MRIGKVLVGILCVATFVGCSSYRVTGRFMSPGEAHPQPTAQKYHIAHLAIDAARGGNQAVRDMNRDNPFVMADPWSIAQTVSLMKMEQLAEKIEESFPDVFANDASAQRIDVKVICRNEDQRYGVTILFPYLVSLGTLPAIQETLSDCTVEVRATADSKRIGRVVPIELASIMKLTVFSPIGLIDFERPTDVISQRHGSGIMAAPHLDPSVRQNFSRVFAESVGAAVCRALK